MAALPRDLSVCLYIGRLFLSLYDPVFVDPNRAHGLKVWRSLPRLGKGRRRSVTGVI